MAGRTSDSAEPPPGYAWRLTFRYDGDSVELISRERVAMIPPPPDPETGEARFRVELRDGGDQPVFSQRLDNPVSHEREVFSDDPERPIRHVHVDEPKGAFQVIVPDHPDAADLVLELAEPATPGPGDDDETFARASGTRKEIARVPLGGDSGDSRRPRPRSRK